MKKHIIQKFIDIIRLNLFHKDDFADWDHLNYQGAQKCTNFIERKMAETQELQRESNPSICK